MKKAGIILMIVVGVAVLAFANGYFKGNQQNQQKQIVMPRILKIGDVTLNVGVANTEAAREQGLSGKIAKDGDPIGLGFGENEGLLFIFEKPGYYGFWMKDMNFPIDMAWIDSNKKIVFIESNVSPATYPKIFNSNSPSLYVLETPAGFFEKHEIKIGDIAEF